MMTIYILIFISIVPTKYKSIIWMKGVIVKHLYTIWVGGGGLYGGST